MTHWGTMKSGLAAWLLLALLPLLISCSGGGSTPGSADAVPARLVGAIPDQYAYEVSRLFSSESAGSGVPVLIGAADLASLSALDRAAILDAFDRDTPIVLIKPTLERIQALRDLVGIEGNDRADDLPEFWALQTNRSFEIWEYYFDAPASRQLVKQDTATLENGRLSVAYGSEVAAELLDSPVYRLARLESLRDWLRDAPQRALAAEAEAPGAAAKAVGGADAVAMTAEAAGPSQAGPAGLPKTVAEPGIEAVDLMKILGADHSVANFSYLNNKYGVSLASRTVYQAPYTYFVIESRGVFAANGEWEASAPQSERSYDASHDRGSVAYMYDVSFSVPQAGPDEVMEVSSIIPRTVESITEVSDSFGWELGGKATLAGECKASDSFGCTAKAGIDVSGGVKASVTTRTSVRDVVVSNTSRPGQPSWNFTIPPPEPNTRYFVTWLGIDIFWTFPKEMAISTFQPNMAWVWRVSDTLRARYPDGLPVAIEFLPTLMHCYSGERQVRTGNYPHGSAVRLQQRPAAAMTYQVNLPWAPSAAGR